MSDSIHYVYGIVPSSLAMDKAPAGLDDTPVVLESEGGIGALVSQLDAATYGESVDDRLTDLTWLGPRAVAHDRVVTWASDRGPVVPLPMFSMFRGRDRVRKMLGARVDEILPALRSVERGREYAVRLFRLDTLLLGAVAELSPRVAELEAAANAASPGQRYLLERKLEAERVSETRRVAGEVARETFDALRAESLEAVSDPLPRQGRDGAAGIAILNAAFLVSHHCLESFQGVLTTLIERYEPRGFRFDFTGPWPPYHFVGAAAARDASVAS